LACFDYLLLSSSLRNFMQCIIFQLPLVEDELKRAAGDKTGEEESASHSSSVHKLVTSDGTYATQSAFNTST
jgi:coatomer subunit beta